ncbi:MAG TPA: hypothetical protein PK869_04845 [Candidatus Hydrogenedentes bacterium]|nr:hypothetical protein [Candidatus Hydrogenedentota bacterium]
MTDTSLPREARLEFSFKIMQPNAQAVAEKYDSLLSSAKAGLADAKDLDERSLALDKLLYCREPIALKYQLRLLAGDVPAISPVLTECRITDLIGYLLQSENAEVANGLVEVFNELSQQEKPVESSFRQFLSNAVLWAIHELNSSSSNPNVIAATDAIVISHEKPRDPRPVPGLD